MLVKWRYHSKNKLYTLKQIIILTKIILIKLFFTALLEHSNKGDDIWQIKKWEGSAHI